MLYIGTLTLVYPPVRALENGLPLKKGKKSPI